MQNDLKSITETIQNCNEGNPLEEILRGIHKIVKPDFCCITDPVSSPSGEVKTICTLDAQGNVIDNFIYPLFGTPCQLVSQGQVCIYDNNVQESFPEDLALVEMGVHSYVGIPIGQKNQNSPVGIVSALFKNSIPNPEMVRNTMEHYAAILSFAIGHDDGLQIMTSNAHAFRSRTLKRIQQDNEFFTSTLNHMPAMYYAKDTLGKVISVNHQFLSYFGLKEKQVLGKCDSEFLPSDISSEFRQRDVEVIQKRITTTHEELYTSLKSGEEQDFDVHRFPYFDKQGNIFAVGVVYIDVTLTRKQERETEENRLAAETSARLISLGEMAGGIAHEINNPLSIIQGYAGILKKQIQKESIGKEESISITEKIFNSVDRIQKIVRGLKSFARDASEDPMENVLAREIFEHPLSICKEKFNSRGIELIVDASINSYEGAVRCREFQIGQVVINLLNNAHDAVLEGDCLTKSIRCGILQTDGFACLYVEDNGPGIPKEVEEKIFNPFFTTKPVGIGSGMGLSISRSIIEQHGGQLDVKRMNGKTRFTIKIPYLEASQLSTAA